MLQIPRFEIEPVDVTMNYISGGNNEQTKF